MLLSAPPPHPLCTWRKKALIAAKLLHLQPTRCGDGAAGAVGAAAGNRAPDAPSGDAGLLQPAGRHPGRPAPRRAALHELHHRGLLRIRQEGTLVTTGLSTRISLCLHRLSLCVCAALSSASPHGAPFSTGAIFILSALVTARAARTLWRLCAARGVVAVNLPRVSQVLNGGAARAAASSEEGTATAHETNP